ncbi:MAG: hypothetical protein ACRDV4_02700, partial [Acidimicrobiales bacterium]
MRWRRPVGVLATVTISVIAFSAGIASAQGVAPQFGSVQGGTPGSTTLTVQATVNPEGQSTSYVVNYGPTTSYGSSTSSASAGSGTSLVSISAQVTGLTPATAYHLQLVVTNASGSASSPDLVLETAPSSSTPPATTPTPVTEPTVPKRPTKPTTSTTASGGHLARVSFPADGMASQSLDSIACATTATCFVVGSGGGPEPSTKLPSFAALVARGSGARWSVMTSPPVHDGALNGVSCASATSCMAVGAVGEPVATTFAEHWNGRSWARVLVPAAASGGNGSQLYSVSCPSASDCLAVGGGNLGTSSAFPLFARWNGAAWSASSSIAAPRYSYLSSVSCA